MSDLLPGSHDLAPPTDAGAFIADALARITEDRLRAAAVGVTAIPSPTGREAPLAHWLVDRLAESGVDAQVQYIAGEQANALGRIRGDGSGSDLLLYAPIDTLLTGRADVDLPWAGSHQRPDMVAEAVVDGPFVTGLGASNPKGHAACVLVVAQAFAEAARAVGLAQHGDLLVGFGAGGMPTNAIDYGDGTFRANTGHGVGCSFLLERGWYADNAIIAKPGDFVAYDEVGLCWFEITVTGIHTYVGSRHRLPYQNPIVSAAAVVQRLENWLAEYPARHHTPTAAPQGVIGSIAAGWERMLAVTPAACRIRLDLRTAPGVAPSRVKRELAGFVREVAAELDLEIAIELVNAIPGTRTEPSSWIISETIRAWETASGREHVAIADNSGATDANILRGRMVPTARVGMPKVVSDAFDVDFERGMNTVDVRDMRRLCEVLLRVAAASTTTIGGVRDEQSLSGNQVTEER